MSSRLNVQFNQLNDSTPHEFSITINNATEGELKLILIKCMELIRDTPEFKKNAEFENLAGVNPYGPMNFEKVILKLSEYDSMVYNGVVKHHNFRSIQQATHHFFMKEMAHIVNKIAIR